MDNKDLIRQYVDTGVGIPEYQFNQLSNNDKRTYLRKIEISIKSNIGQIEFYYGVLPEDKQLEIIKKSIDTFKFLKNPTEQVQLFAVNKNGYFIRFIENPSKEVQLAAIYEDANSIKFINNSNEFIQWTAVNQKGTSIQYIDNPSNKIQLAAVNKDPNSLYYIENPSEEVQLAAVSKDGNSIEYIDNPSEAVQLAALNNIVSKSYGSIELNNNLLGLYKYISEKNKLKVVNYLINNSAINDSFYLKLDNNTKEYVLDKIFSNKISMGEKFYESLPEDRKLEYLKMEIDKANEKNGFLGSWVREEYKKMTGIELVRIDKQYIKQNG